MRETRQDNRGKARRKAKRRILNMVRKNIEVKLKQMTEARIARQQG